MHESQRVPGYRFRNFDEVELEKASKENVRKYEVAADDALTQAQRKDGEPAGDAKTNQVD